MKSTIALPLLASFAIGLILPNYAFAQQPAAASPAQADRALAQEKADMKNAYRSRDPKAIATERAEARQAYVADYRADHPRRHRTRHHHHQVEPTRDDHGPQH